MHKSKHQPVQGELLHRPDFSELRMFLPIAPVTMQSETRAHRSRVYSTKRKKDYQLRIARAIQAYAPSEPYDGPVMLKVVLFLARPKYLVDTHPDKALLHVTTPDYDDLVKPIQDCLGRFLPFRNADKTRIPGGGVIEDDKQITDTVIKKRYTESNRKPRIIIKIKPLKKQW